MPAPSSHSRGGGLPWRGASVTVLETKAANGNPVEQRVAERAPGGDRVERARAVHDRVRELDAAEGSIMREARSVSSVGRVEHGPVDAQAHVAVAGRDDAAEAGAEAARHAGLERELGGHVVLGAERAHGLEHRRRPAGVDLARTSRPSSAASSSVTSPWWPREPSSVATRALVQQRRALGVRGVAEAEQRERRRAQRVLPDRQRRDPDAAADEDRPARLARRGEAAPERAEQPQLVARVQLGEPLRAGADILQQEVERCRWSSWRRATENARGRNGPLVGPAAPALDGREHRGTGRGRAPAPRGSATDRTT